MPQLPGPARHLTLPASLDVTTLGPLLAELISLRGAPLTVDGSAVAKTGGLGLQLLISAQRTWAQDSQPLRFIDLSPTLEDAFALAGATATAPQS